MRLNKIHLGPVYSYLIFIFIRNSVRRKFHFFNDDLRDRQTSQLFLTETLYPSFPRRLLHLSVVRALSRHCVLRYFLLAYAQSTYDYLRIRLRSFVSSILSYYSLKPRTSSDLRPQSTLRATLQLQTTLQALTAYKIYCGRDSCNDLRAENH